MTWKGSRGIKPLGICTHFGDPEDWLLWSSGEWTSRVKISLCFCFYKSVFQIKINQINLLKRLWYPITTEKLIHWTFPTYVWRIFPNCQIFSITLTSQIKSNLFLLSNSASSLISSHPQVTPEDFLSSCLFVSCFSRSKIYLLVVFVCSQVLQSTPHLAKKKSGTH